MEIKDVFISHASEDKPIAEVLARELDNFAISYWLDEFEIGWGQEIGRKIENGIVSSKYVIVLVSLAFLSKQWTLFEMNLALKRETDEGTFHILPILLETIDLKQAGFPTLASRRLLSWNDGSKEIVKNVAIVIGRQFKQVWDFNHPEEYVGAIWIKMRALPEYSGRRHSFTIKWGPWTRGGSQVLLHDRAIALVHSKGNDGLSLPIRMTVDPECNISFGQGNPGPIYCKDLNPWWTQFEDRFRLWIARKLLWSR
jgi:hypothetical protein